MFYHRTNKRPTEGLSVGAKTKPKYAIKANEFGHKEVYQSGETNFYAAIQEQAEALKIENIIKRAQMGDPTALNAGAPQFIDVSEAPTNMIDMHNLTREASNQFYSLPLNIRAAYNHSPEEFIADYGSTKMKNLFKTLEPKTKELPEQNIPSKEKANE